MHTAPDQPTDESTWKSRGYGDGYGTGLEMVLPVLYLRGGEVSYDGRSRARAMKHSACYETYDQKTLSTIQVEVWTFKR